MTNERAYNITRSFVTMGCLFEKEDKRFTETSLFKGRLFYLNNTTYPFYFYVKNFSKEKTIKENILEITHKSEVDCITFKIPLYLTSVGVITEDEYLLAEDIIDNHSTIYKKDLVENAIYEASNGKKYTYLGDFKILFLGVLYDLKDMFYDKKYNKLITFSSLKIVNLLEYSEKNININKKIIDTCFLSRFNSYGREIGFHASLESINDCEIIQQPLSLIIE